MSLARKLLSLRVLVRAPELHICCCLPHTLFFSGTSVLSWELPFSVDIVLTVSLDALRSPSPRDGHKTPSQTKQTSKSGEWWPATRIPLGLVFSCLVCG